MAIALRDVYGNASSMHRAGQSARQHFENSRRTVANFLSASATEIVFTSGGTEANNLAILGIVRELDGACKHVVTTPIEHPSVLECVRQLGREGVDVSVVDDRGFELDGVALYPVEVGHTDTDATTMLHVPEMSLLVAGDVV